MSKNFEDCDHAAWRVQEHQWDDIDSFLAAKTWADGIHSIQVPAAPHIDLLINGLAVAEADARALPVFFNGAVTSREAKKAPFFSGVSVAAENGLPYIALSDPSLSLNKSLGLAWYAGNMHAAYQDLIEKLLCGVYEVVRRELLLIGGSGGGFASLYYGHKLGAKASVLVWNPQTNILEYNPTFAKNYISVALGEDSGLNLSLPDWKDKATGLAVENRISLDLTSDFDLGMPRRIVYLQNADDWHVVSHLVPYLQRFDYFYTGKGGYCRDDNHQTWIAQIGDGHAPPSREVVAKAIELLREPAVTARHVVDEMRRAALFGDQKPGLLPRDLTGLTDRLRELVRFNAAATESGVVLRVELGIVPPGYGGLTMQFSEIINGASKVLRYFDSGSELELEQTEGDGADRYFNVVLRDGFGNRLLHLDAELVGSARRRLILYGSSTSMEAFAQPSDFELLDYIARCSVGSAFQPKVDGLIASLGEIYPLTDPFLRRILEIDLGKGLREALSATDFDFLLVDFIDERIPLLRVNSSYLTFSPELKRTGYQGAAQDEVRPGSAEHLELCKDGISSLVALVGAHRIVVNKVFWASHNTAGEPLSQVREIYEMNEMLSSIYGFLSVIEGIRFIEYPESILLAEENHKWGPTPYRFGSAVHRHLLERLANM